MLPFDQDSLQPPLFVLFRWIMFLCSTGPTTYPTTRKQRAGIRSTLLGTNIILFPAGIFWVNDSHLLKKAGGICFLVPWRVCRWIGAFQVWVSFYDEAFVVPGFSLEAKDREHITRTVPGLEGWIWVIPCADLLFSLGIHHVKSIGWLRFGILLVIQDAPVMRRYPSVVQ